MWMGLWLGRHVGLRWWRRRRWLWLSRWWRKMSRMRVVLGPPPLIRCIPLRLWLSIRVKRMSSWLGIIWICEGTRRRCEPGRMSRGTPRRHESGLIGVIIGLGCPL